MNTRQGNSFFKINVEKYDYLLGFCTQQNSALLQMLIFLPILGNFARSKQQPWVQLAYVTTQYTFGDEKELKNDELEFLISGLTFTKVRKALKKDT